MALEKEITLASGVITNYHKVAKLEIDFHKQEARIVVYSFLDQKARDAGCEPVQEAGYSMPDGVFPFVPGGNTQEEAYESIKLIDSNFTDAKDV